MRGTTKESMGLDPWTIIIGCVQGLQLCVLVTEGMNVEYCV